MPSARILRDELAAAGEQAEPRPDRAVLVEAGRAELDAELERPRLAEDRGADARAAGVVDEDRNVRLARRGDRRLDVLVRQRRRT